MNLHRKTGLEAQVLALPGCDLRAARHERLHQAATSVNESLNLFYPMNEFYEQAGVPLPGVVRVEGRDVPEPYRGLLVHNRDMTPTLASAYGRNMQLRVFGKILREDVFVRQIALQIEGDGKAVIFAAIKIFLDRFSAEAKRLILEARQPFGTILHDQKIAHVSRPEAFIQVTADDTIGHALGLKTPSVLYGRRSALWNSDDLALAQVLEILPPSA